MRPATLHHRSVLGVGHAGVQQLRRTAHLFPDPVVHRVAAVGQGAAFATQILPHAGGIDGLERGRGHLLDQFAQVGAADLLDFRPEAPITEAGLRNNISVGIQYLGAWLAGNGCVPVFNLMEDAATAEISRSQIWQWIRSDKGVLEDGRKQDIASLVLIHGGRAFNVQAPPPPPAPPSWLGTAWPAWPGRPGR